MFLLTSMLAVAASAPDAKVEKKLPIQQEIVQPEVVVEEETQEEIALVVEDEEAPEQQ